MTYRIQDQLIKRSNRLFIHLCYVVLCITKAELTECYILFLTACMHTHTEPMSHNMRDSYTISPLQYLCGATKHL